MLTLAYMLTLQPSIIFTVSLPHSRCICHDRGFFFFFLITPKKKSRGKECLLVKLLLILQIAGWLARTANICSSLEQMNKKTNPLFTLWLSLKETTIQTLYTEYLSLYQSPMHTASAHLETPAHGPVEGWGLSDSGK